MLSLVPLVRAIAADTIRGKPRTILFEDLVGYGMVGLCEAAQRFDPSQGTKFSTYAYRRIQGSILDGLRAMSGVSKRQLQLDLPTVEACSLENLPGLDHSDNGRTAADLEDAILIRELLDRVAPSTADFVDQIFHTDTDKTMAKVLSVSRSWVSVLKARAIDGLKRAA